jgi:hypothetical protein
MVEFGVGLLCFETPKQQHHQKPQLVRFLCCEFSPVVSLVCVVKFGPNWKFVLQKVWV